MNLEAVFQAGLNFNGDLFGGNLTTRTDFEEKKYPMIESGLQAMRERGVEIYFETPAFPYLYLRDGQATRVVEHYGHGYLWGPRLVEPCDQIVDSLPPTLRKVGFAVGVEMITKKDTSETPIRVMFSSDNSVKSRELFLDMTIEEGIQTRIVTK